METAYFNVNKHDEAHRWVHEEGSEDLEWDNWTINIMLDTVSIL